MSKRWAERVRTMAGTEEVSAGPPYALDYRAPSREAPAARPRYPGLAWAEILVLTSVFMFVAVLGLAAVLYFVMQFL